MVTKTRPQIKPFFRPSQALRPRPAPVVAPPPPLITEEQAVEYATNLSPSNYRKLNSMIGAEIARMVMPWEVTGPLWAYARRKVITELINREVVLDELGNDD